MLAWLISVATPANAAVDDPRDGVPIDRFVEAALDAAGVAPRPEADRRTLVRRLYLVLHGLPPTPQEVARAYADDRGDWYEALVDELLSSPRYGERWAAHWLDVVRYADTHGFETNTERPHAWRYRDWVIDAFHRDMPYDRFVLAQLAGDTIGEDAATGFLVAGPWDEVKSPDPVLTAQQRQDELADMVGAVGSSFLGATVACARCHDHKFDPISQTDFYSMAAVFSGVRHGDRRLPDADDAERRRRVSAIDAQLARLDLAFLGDDPHAATEPAPAPRRAPIHALRVVDRFAPRLAIAVRLTVEATADGMEPCIDELEVFAAATDAEASQGRPDVAPPDNVGLSTRGARASASSVLPGSAIHRVAHLNDGAYGNARSWISNEPSGGWVQIDLAEPVTIDRVAWGRDRLGDYQDRLAVRYRLEVAATPGAWRLVASSDDRARFEGPVAAIRSNAGAPASSCRAELGDAWLAERSALLAERARWNAPRLAYAGHLGESEPTYRLHRGDPMQPREAMSPGGIASFGEFSPPPGEREPQRRAALARWITGPARHRAARVMVNRLWQHDFGAGLVTSPSDHGENGASPTHPALLDALADELIRSGWSLKHVQRQILRSATFRRSGSPDPRAIEVDPDDRLLWRYPPHRAEAEVIRDSILAIAGSLDPRMGGPGYSVFEPNQNYVRVYDPKREFGPEEWRRAIYAQRVRMEKDATFGVFDCPDGGQAAPRRARSITALQALSLLNSPFVVQQSARFAARVATDPSPVDRAFSLALQRPPSQEEADASRELVARHGLSALCRALFQTNELVLIP